MKPQTYMDALLEEEREKNRIPGAQIGIYKGDETLYEKEYGYQKDSIYRMYSMTKPVTAVAAMIMYQRGKLDLLSPISEYLPEYRDMTVLTETGSKNAKRQIQIWDLLNMTSGIVYPDEDLAGREMEQKIAKVQERVDTPEAFTTRQVAKMIAEAPLAAEPGDRWRYGLSADVLGAVIEYIDGRNLSQFYQEEIFEPLGMEDTSFWVPQEKRSRLVKLFYQEEEGERMVLREDESRHLGLGHGLVPPAFVSGGAGLYSTRRDYKNFARMLLLKGGLPKGDGLVSEEVFSMFVQNHLTLEQKKTVDFAHMAGYGYGSLMRIHEDARQSGSSSGMGEFGWDGWTGPYCSVDCERDRIFLFMTQVSGYSDWPLIRKMKAVANTF